MMFYKFIRACAIYKFYFVFKTYNERQLLLRPENSFDNIIIPFYRKDFMYRKLFKRAIIEMKDYRLRH